MLKYKIIEFLNIHSRLTYNGIEWNRNQPKYEESRVDLYENLDEIIKCIDWLDRFYVPSKRKKDETNSYSLKHYVEKYCDTYISNGAFVAAIMWKGYDYKTINNNPNIFIRLEPKPLADFKYLYRHYKKV